MLDLLNCSIITGLILLTLGISLKSSNAKIRNGILSFPRSVKCSIWFVGLSTVWFLWRHVAFLSEADFGNYKLLIGTLALGVAVLSFVFVSDFLAVRGLAMLILLWAREVLDAAFLHETTSRLFLVAVVYFLIVGALYFGAWPYKIRNLLEWMNIRVSRFNFAGWVFSATGVLILFLSFTY